MSRAWIAAIAVAALVLGGCTADDDPEPPAAASSAPTFTPGAEGIGDPYFPTYGNGGYDVAGYDLKLRYDPKTGVLGGSATITATATQDLSAFNLDLAHLTAQKVTVDGQAASSKANLNELVVTPAAGLVNGRPFTVVVDYSGKPEPLNNATLGVGGWLRTKDGAFALGQPESASTWFPVNDHPRDKATFKLAMTVPEGVEAISNGVPLERSTGAGWTTWRWVEDTPMASYLSMVVIGQYRVESGTHKGKPIINATPESLPANGAGAKSIAKTAEITDFLETQFGPYPFDAYGGIVLDDERVGYALETQTRPVYGNTFFGQGPDFEVVAHELAHQWFGDSVALERWQDIWLNEGFATYAEWLWRAHEGKGDVQASFDGVYRGFDWTELTGEPGPQNIFGPAVYQRGAMTVHALRLTIGDKAFFDLLKTWTTEQRNGTATTAEFIATAEKVSGKDLKSLFDAWLLGSVAPPKP